MEYFIKIKDLQYFLRSKNIESEQKNKKIVDKITGRLYNGYYIVSL